MSVSLIELEKSSNSLSLPYIAYLFQLIMEFIEIIAWLCVGFIPTLGLGNLIWSRVDKRKEKPIPWSV